MKQKFKDGLVFSAKMVVGLIVFFSALRIIVSIDFEMLGMVVVVPITVLVCAYILGDLVYCWISEYFRQRR